jgi:lambda repressor-like predicted transcriptional regulator
MDRKQAEAAVAKHGSIRAAARASGVAYTTLQQVISGRGDRRKKPTHAAVETTPQQAKTGRSLTEFRDTYDKATIIPAKIKTALKTLGSGWEYEVEFAKLASVSLVDLGRFRDAFSEHVVTIGRDSKRAWAGTITTAKAMREML